MGKNVYRKGQEVGGMQSNAGTIHGLRFSGAPSIVGVKRLCRGASVHEGITDSKERQAKEKGGKKTSLLQSVSSESG